MAIASLQAVGGGHLSIQLAVFIAFAFLFYKMITNAVGNKKQLPLPPAPAGYPFIGNLIDMAKAGPQTHLQLFKWAQQHGEVFRIQVGPITEYFLNSDAIVKVCVHVLDV